MTRAFLIAALIFSSPATALAAAQEPSFEALGQAPITGGDRVRARERALDEAMRQAVEQATATVLEPDQLVARASDLRLRIYPKARGYVTNYRVLDEGEAEGAASPTFQVRISAQVATARLARDLALSSTANSALPKLPSARAVVCTRSSGLAVGGAAEQAVRTLLQARGVEIAAAPASCGEESAAGAARAASAQGAVVAIVDAAAAGAIRGTERAAAHAHVRLRLIEADGRVSADAEAEADASDSAADKAAPAATREAADEAARSLGPAIAARWPSSAPTGGVRVRLIGAGRYADYLAVSRALAGLPGVAAVEPRRFTRNDADLFVRTASSAAQIAEGLRRVPSSTWTVSAGGDSLEIHVVTPDPNINP